MRGKSNKKNNGSSLLDLVALPRPIFNSSLAKGRRTCIGFAFMKVLEFAKDGNLWRCLNCGMEPRLLITGGVTQEETVSSIVSTSSSSSSSSPPRPATTPAPTEDYESIDVNVSSSSAAAASEARGGGAPAAGLHRRPGSSDVGCRGLRSKRYISDGFCRTLKPISEVLCTGYCVPERNMPWYPEFMQIWGRAKVMEYRCVDGVVRNQKIRLMCDNGKMRVYNVRVVKSCSCRKHVRPPSSSLQPLNRSHQLPSSATNASALAVADADTTPSRKHNKQRHHGKKRPEPKKNA